MKFRARRTAAALDKARELSRKEPSVDWSEAEWKKLMAAAVAQKIEEEAEHKEPNRKALYLKPALAYGGAALIMMAIIGYTLRNSFFRPAAAPEPYAQAVERKDVSPATPALETMPPGYAGGIAKPSEGDAAKARSETSALDARAKASDAVKSLPAVVAKAQEAAAPMPGAPAIQPRKPVPAGERAKKLEAAGTASAQDVVTVKLVSPETGLQIVWVLNRNFEWKGENQ